MIQYNFKKVSREQLAKIAENAIKALADKRNFDVFTLTLEVDCDESDIEVIKGGAVMEGNTQKFEIKIDPLDFHEGLKDKMAEFESLIRMERLGTKLAEEINKRLESRFCHCCFFGHVEGVLMGEPLCKECAKVLYGFDESEERPSIKNIDPYYQLWYRRQKALPIFEAYLQSELKRFELELKLEEATNAEV